MIAQKPQDAALWMGIDEEVDVSEKWEIQASQQVRLFKNMRAYDNSFVELGAKYKANKWYSVAPVVRLSNATMANGIRFQVDQTLTQDLPNKFWIKHRVRIQYSDILPYSLDFYRLRYRLKAEKRIANDLVLFVEPEIFYFLKQGFNRFDQYRLEGGLVIEMLHKDALEWQLFYIYEEQINRENPGITHIWGIEASLKLNKLYRLVTTGSAKKNKDESTEQRSEHTCLGLISAFDNSC